MVSDVNLQPYSAGPIVLVAYYVIGIPLAIFLSFYLKIGPMGLAIGRDAQPALVIGRHYITERDSAPVQYNGIL